MLYTGCNLFLPATDIKMDYPTQTINWKGTKFAFTWIKREDDFDLSSLSPITQAYGVCITNDGMAVILDQKGDGTWTLPGGTVETGEKPVETLIREVMEEADIELDTVVLVGSQKVESEGKTYFQTRFVARVTKILPQTTDPAMGRIHERKLVPVTDITSYVKWGNTGDAMFADALEKARKHKIYTQ